MDNVQPSFCSIEHIAIAALDPEALADWYIRVLGSRVRVTFDNGPGKPKTFMLEFGNDAAMFEIFAAADNGALSERPNTLPGLAHIALAVNDFDGAVKRLDAAGVKREGVERQAPFGARVQFYRDPEGNLFHLVFRPQRLPG